MFAWSFWGGFIVALIGLLAFGGFAQGSLVLGRKSPSHRP